MAENDYDASRQTYTGDKNSVNYRTVPVPVEVDPPEAVNHPAHYNQSPVEVIDLIRGMPFSRGNVIKYVARAGYKGGPEEELKDMHKALFYLKDVITELEKKAQN